MGCRLNSSKLITAMDLSIEHADGIAGLRGRLDIQTVPMLNAILAGYPRQPFDLTKAQQLDSAAAMVLWEYWGSSLPPQTRLTEKQRTLFDYIRETPAADLHAFPTTRELRAKRASRSSLFGTAIGLLTTFGRLLLDLGLLLGHPRLWPLREISAACYRSGVTAVPISVIVGFLIGIVLSYLSSLTLRDFGAESFLPLVMGVGILRELGPLLTAIVLAGRSGSSITASLGAMRLTQELDALSVLGISHSRRLVVPRAIALALMTPLLVVCTNIAALAGGMLSGWAELDLSSAAYMAGLRNDVAMVHLTIGLFKSMIFGLTIAVIACYFGLSSRPNSQSLATHTTRSVVLSISAIIVLDAFFAVVFKDLS